MREKELSHFMLVCTLEDSARNIDNTSWGCTYFYIFMNFYLTFEYLTKNAPLGRLSSVLRLYLGTYGCGVGA